MPRTCTILPLLLLILAPATAAGQALPTHVRQALERGSQRLDPIQVVWRETFIAPRSRSEAVDELELDEASAAALFGSTIRRLSLAGGRFHQLCEYPGRMSPTEASFDGAILYQGYPEGQGDEPPQLVKTLLARVVKEDPDAPLIESGYFAAVGFTIPATAPELAARRKPESSVLQLLRREGAKLVGMTGVTVDGRAVLRVQVDAPAAPQAAGGAAERRYVFDLDTAMGYALRRYEERQDGRVLLVRTNDDFREIRPRNLWLPRTSRTDHYTWPTLEGTVHDQPVLMQLIEARSVDGTEISDDRFVLEYTMAGSRITDRSAREGAATFTIGVADGRPAPESSGSVSADAGPGGRWRTASIIGAAAAMAMIGLALILQRRRIRSTM